MNHTGDITMYAYRSKSPIVEAGLRYQAETAERKHNAKRAAADAIRQAELAIRRQHAAERRRAFFARLDKLLTPQPPMPSMVRIAGEVAAKHGVTVDELKSERRIHQFVRARQEAMWRCYHEARKSYPQIAQFFGGRDHTTAIHAVREHQARIDRGEA